MKKKFLGLIFTLCFTLLFTYGVKADGLQVTRLDGNSVSTIGTRAVDKGWQKSDYAVIVNENDSPDMISASILARKYSAPVIFSDSDILNGYQMSQITKLGVKKVFLVGGTAVLSANFEFIFQTSGISCERICGADRYQTSIAIAKRIGTQNGVTIVAGDDYIDALSMIPIAGKLQMPIILSRKDVLDSVQKKFVAENVIPKSYVIGNADLISNNVVSKLPNVQRIATGFDVYSRNLNIINTFKSSLDFSNIFLAINDNSVSGLGGSVFAALNGNPIILADNISEKPYIESLLSENKTTNIYALGDQYTIKDDFLNDIVGGTNALNIIKSKVKLSENLNLKIGYEKYKYDGSSYYVVSLHERRNGLDLCGFYQYDFLVDTETGDTYKLDINTKEITPLDDMQIGLNTNDKQKALETVADHVTEKDDNTVVECDGIEDKDNMNCYIIHVYDNLYDHISTIDFYYAEIGTGKIYIHDADTDTIKPIN